MKTLTIFTMSLVFIWLCSADHHKKKLDKPKKAHVSDDKDPPNLKKTADHHKATTDHHEETTNHHEKTTAHHAHHEKTTAHYEKTTDHHEETTTENPESATENPDPTIKFYKCISCGRQEVIAAYKKCRELKSEHIQNITEECSAKVLPKKEMEGDKRWKHYCKKSEDITKVMECFTDYYDKLTEEDEVALLAFKDCAEKVNKKYCQKMDENPPNVTKDS